MALHRSIRLACLVGAAIAPMLSAILIQNAARVAVRSFLPPAPGSPYPLLTQTWVVSVAGGQFPLLALSFVITLLVLGLGASVLISKRVSSEVQASSLLVLCCMGFAAAVLSAASSLLAMTLPFLQQSLR